MFLLPVFGLVAVGKGTVAESPHSGRAWALRDHAGEGTVHMRWHLRCAGCGPGAEGDGGELLPENEKGGDDQ